MIAEWDLATRSMWDCLPIIKAVIDDGAAIKVLDRSYIDLTVAPRLSRGYPMIADRSAVALVGLGHAFLQVF